MGSRRRFSEASQAHRKPSKDPRRLASVKGSLENRVGPLKFLNTPAARELGVLSTALIPTGTPQDESAAFDQFWDRGQPEEPELESAGWRRTRLRSAV